MSGVVNKETVSGSVGALFCVSAGMPFDTIKARLQTNNGRIGALESVKGLVTKEGPKALFSGFYPALASATIENAVVWSMNSYLREKWVENSDSNDIANHHQAVLGALTGAVSAVAITPAEVIKVRLQTRRIHPTHAAFRVVGDILRTAGPRGFFFGLFPTLMRDIPFYFCFFGAMETYRSFFHEDSLVHAAIGGGFAGSCAWSMIFPADVLKTRQQVNGWTMRETIRRAVAEPKCIQNLYRGVVPAVVRAFPANGALVLGVELSRSFFDKNFGFESMEYNR